MMPSNSVGEISSIKCTYKWVIKNFCAGCKSVGEVMKSPVFTKLDSGYLRKWRLRLFPKGNKDECKDYVSIFLCNLNNVDLKADAYFSILDNKGLETFYEFLPNHVFNHNTYSGFSTFVKRECIEDKDWNMLCDDKLAIVCKISLITPNEHIANEETEKKETSTKVYRPKIYPASLMIQRKYTESKQLLADLEQMMDEQEFSDIELTVEDKTLRAHKSILGKRSRVFAAMFRNDMCEKRENKVKIVDVRHEVLQEMLRYMYTGKVNGIETMTDELLIAADKYSLDGLKGMCGEVLANDVNKSNAMDRLKFAVLHRVDVLRAKVIEFVVESACDIVDNPEFQQLPANVICEVCSVFAADKKK
ncbi:protein roadkill [Nasonia vitripennis]|uniref:Uncharacterized protein n=1 Tax=Nasonia vitripennis TaxID=7425 RepID=A0A7M7H550_NASVI|nr:protein roadkill [Nasonia vitripennis]XP_008208722.1 protein roadkill [Nasonia vitripennis]XP_008208723.1 protein roadkill [Nasonia vitripennis]